MWIRKKTRKLLLENLKKQHLLIRKGLKKKKFYKKKFYKKRFLKKREKRHYSTFPSYEIILTITKTIQ